MEETLQPEGSRRKEWRDVDGWISVTVTIVPWNTRPRKPGHTRERDDEYGGDEDMNRKRR